MILPVKNLIVPDDTGGLRPTALTLMWPAGSDVTIQFAVKHADGTAYDLSGAVAGIMAFKAKASDDDALIQREWTIVDDANGLVEFSIVRGDITLLPEGNYAIGVQFRDDDTDFEDSVLGDPSKLIVTPRIADFDENVTALPSQVPLGRGPSGVIEIDALVISNIALTGIPAAQDGVTVVAGTELLLVGQTDQTQQGPWVVAAGAWSRPTYFAVGGSAASTGLFKIIGGTTYGAQLWQCTAKYPDDVIGTNNLTFTQVTSVGGVQSVSALANNPAAVDNTVPSTPVVSVTLGATAITAAAGNDARFPTAGQKLALAGTSGTPGTGNEYVTDDDPRMTDDRVPVDHATSHVTGGGDVIANAVAAGNAGLMTGADKTKLDGIEALADVTDAANVATAIAAGESATSTATVTTGALLKNSGNGTYDHLDVGGGDSPLKMIGIVIAGRTGAGIFTAQFRPGGLQSLLSDGSGTIAQGAYVIPSTTVAGRVKQGISTDIGIVGINVGALVAATLDAAVSVR